MLKHFCPLLDRPIQVLPIVLIMSFIAKGSTPGSHVTF